MDEPDQYIDFMAKYKDWVAIKRIGIRPDTKPEEIAFYLAGVRATADKRSYQILGIKTEPIDNFVKQATSGLGKKAESLVTVMGQYKSSDAKSAIEQAISGNSDLKQFAEAYLLNSLIAAVGFDTAISQVAMSKVWKNLKLPKPKGRMPGSGKKKEEAAEA